jgi:hypothetical protein
VIKDDDSKLIKVLKVEIETKKSPIVDRAFFYIRDFYFTSKLALLAIWRASADDLSTLVSSPYPL